MKKIVLLLALLVIAILAWIGLPPKEWPKPSDTYLADVAKEISSEGEFNKSLAISPDGSELAYPRSTQGGRALFLMDVKTGKTTKITNAFEAYHVYAYSPDGTRLLFSDFQRPGNNRLMVLPRPGAAAKPIEKGTFANTAWIDDNQLCFTDEKQQHARVLSMDGPESTTTNTFRLESGTHGITPNGPEMFTVISDLGIHLLSWREGIKKMIFQNTNKVGPAWNDSYPLMWLRYCPGTSNYLFSSWDQSNWRHLFCLKKDENNHWAASQISDTNDHVYNAQWIQNGKGFAYIGNQTNHLFLAVRPANPHDATNLFVGGHVFGYTVSQDGAKLYAIASTGPEPLGIWEYGILDHHLRYVGGRAELSAAISIPREEHWVKSADGVNVPYYVSKPRNFKERYKYPVVISAPPEGLQFFRAWEIYSQFLANIGVYFIAVNHRGVDGYGKHYSELEGAPASDIETVYEQVMKMPGVDKDRIYLLAHSAGAEVICQTIEHFPGHWAGAIIFSGSLPSQKQIQQQKMKVFAFVGELDFSLNKTETSRLEQWGKENHLPITVIHAPHTHHVVTDTETQRTSLLELAKFIFDQNP